MPILARRQVVQPMLELTLGLSQTNMTAAVPEDLSARLLSEDPPNFEDTDLQQLLPVYDETVMDRLNRDLSGGLADEMADAVRRVVPSGRGEGLYERLHTELRTGVKEKRHSTFGK